MIHPRIDIDNINAYVYDDDRPRLCQIHSPHRPRTDDTVNRLADLAEEGDVLELGVRSGRFAILLATRCRCVHGIATCAWTLRAAGFSHVDLVVSPS